MKIKTFRAPIVVKEDGQGEFVAVFATLNVIDHDKDVTLPGAFGEQSVLIEPWNHDWGELPVGKGEIAEQDEEALVSGRFFLDTQSGKEHYIVVKELGEQQEWSYSFDIVDSEEGEFEGEKVRFLKALDVIGVGPVTRGAGINTHTVAIKGEGKPYPNEHACRLREPGDFQPDSFRRITREHEGKEYTVIVGRLEGETELTEQAYRYNRETWGEDAARAHCKEHEGRFEAATGEESSCDCDDGKQGARHTRKEYEDIQAIHDLAVELGAKCAEPGDTGGDSDEAGDGKSRKPSPEFYRNRIELEFLDD